MKQLFYYDLTFSFPYPIGDKSGKLERPLKVPAANLRECFFYVDKVLCYDLKTIIEVRVYKVTKTEGNTRVTYKLFSVYDGLLLSSHVAAYKRQVTGILKGLQNG